MAAAALGLASPAAAHITVDGPSCDATEVQAIEDLLDLELAGVASALDAASPVVLLDCVDAAVRIEILDPITDKRVARTIARPSADRARIVALAVTQLFLTSWSELVLDPDSTPRDDEASRAAERIAREAMERALGSAVAPQEAGGDSPASTDTAREAEVAPPSPRLDPDAPLETPLDSRDAPTRGAAVRPELSLEGGVRVRLSGEHLAPIGLGVRAALVLDDAVVVAASVGGELARAYRMRGEVDAYTARLGFGAAWRSSRFDVLFVELGVEVAGVWMKLEGRPRDPSIEGGSTVAIAGEASVSIAPHVALGRVFVGLPLSFGAIAFAPEGRVGGESNVILGGPFVAVMLRIGVALDEI